MLGAGAITSTVLTAYRYTSGLSGSGTVDDDNEVERREALRKIRRRPLSETIEELGEGRGMLDFCLDHNSRLTLTGIYAPGWEERRRQRLLENYGVDVKAAQE